MKLLAADPIPQIEEECGLLIADMEMLVAMSPYQAPLQSAGLEILSARIEQLLVSMLDEFEDGDWSRFEVTQRLIQQAVEDVHALLFQSDLDRGAAPARIYQIPRDWEPGGFTSSSYFVDVIRGWDGRQLLDSYSARHAQIYETIRRRRGSADPETAREMGELARELSRRIYEVPISSRIGFRDAALRLDVLAENLSDYIREENRPYALRQLRVIRRAIQDTEAFLALRENGL